MLRVGNNHKILDALVRLCLQNAGTLGDFCLHNLFFLSQVNHWSVSFLYVAHVCGKLFFGYILMCLKAST